MKKSGCLGVTLGLFVLLAVGCGDPKDTSSDAGMLTHDASHVTSDAAAASQDCIDYCACFETDCDGIQSVPTAQSCTDFCTTFSKSQWQCRIDHCHLVVPEKNPNHCMHAVGIDQCM